jgi:alcohol dehydrogenase class IV
LLNPSQVFEFATARRIIFGEGSFSQAPELAASLGQRMLIVSTRSTDEIAQRLERELDKRNRTTTRYIISGEPDVQSVESGVEAARAASCDCVIALGGGSAIDSGKAIAGLLTNGGSVLDYVEVVGAGKPITRPATPLIAIPTTAGTGTEVTRNAVISIPDKQVKVSIRSPHLLPVVALVDPALTHTMSPEVTASTGLDALTQLIEPYTCNRSTPFSDALALSGLDCAARSLLIAYTEGSPKARYDMAYASLCSGLALANSGLGAVHGFAGVIGGRFPIPHGVCCAILLPHVVSANLTALQSREPHNPALERYRTLEHILAGNYDLVGTLSHLIEDLRIPRLSAFGITADAIPDLVAQSQKASSMKANPIVLTADELASILLFAL